MSKIEEHSLESPDIQKLIASSEFYNKYRSELSRKVLFEVQHHNPIVVEYDVPESQLDAILNHIQKVWTNLGNTEPHWSVASVPDFRADKISDTLDSFNQSGKYEVDNALRMVARSGVSLNSHGTALEYGCGVGRVTRWWAPLFKSMIGVDVSASHLRLARSYMQDSSISNFDLIHIQSFSDIKCLPRYDFLYSKIVLQHNPPPVIYKTLETLIERLNPGGYAIVQFPTYCRNYSFTGNDYIRKMDSISDMEMHVLPQHVVYTLLNRYRCRPLESMRDHLVRSADYVSTTFLFTKEH